MKTEHRPTQNEAILEYLKDRGSITPVDALRELSCMRLASRVSDLRKMGYNIVGEMESARNWRGEPVRYKRYHLEEV